MTELPIDLIARNGGAQVWTGRPAKTQAQGTAADTPAALACKLAGAAVWQFPTPSRDAIPAS